MEELKELKDKLKYLIIEVEKKGTKSEKITR